MTRKERSEAFLKAHSVKINPNLPALESDAAVKPAEEIVRRAVAALLMTQIAIDIANGESGRESAAFFAPYLQRFALEDALTPDEQRYFALADAGAPAVSAEEAAQMTWRIEMTVPLFWASGFLPEWSYPEKPSAYEGAVQIINGCADFAALMQAVQMRPAAEILDAADLILRMDWACVDAMVSGTQITGNLNYDVVMEQHKGFNWMIGAYDAENWDDVKPHT